MPHVLLTSIPADEIDAHVLLDDAERLDGVPPFLALIPDRATLTPLPPFLPLPPSAAGLPTTPPTCSEVLLQSGKPPLYRNSPTQRMPTSVKAMAILIAAPTSIPSQVASPTPPATLRLR